MFNGEFNLEFIKKKNSILEVRQCLIKILKSYFKACETVKVYISVIFCYNFKKLEPLRVTSFTREDLFGWPC